jgi:hypothetical protein
LWQRAGGKEIPDAVLVNRDIVRPQAVKVVATVCAVIGQEDVYDEVSHVKDRAVDIKDDTELVLWIGGAHELVMAGELPHPIGVRRIPLSLSACDFHHGGSRLTM